MTLDRECGECMNSANSTLFVSGTRQNDLPKDAQHLEIDEMRRMTRHIAGKQPIENALGAGGTKNHVENDRGVNDCGVG